MKNEKLTIGIYAPNISKDNLVALLYLQLSSLSEKVEVRLVGAKTRKFRMPEVEAVIASDAKIVLDFILSLFSTAKSIGATRFVFIESDGRKSTRNSTSSEDSLRRLTQELNLRHLHKIEVY